MVTVQGTIALYRDFYSSAFFFFFFFTFQEFTLFIEDTRKILCSNTLLFEPVCLCVWCCGEGYVVSGMGGGEALIINVEVSFKKAVC